MTSCGDLITWGLGYALIGFALDWAAGHYLSSSKSKLNDMAWSAVSIVFWPIALLIGVFLGLVTAWRRRKVG